jgi:hypothetical protein
MRIDSYLDIDIGILVHNQRLKADLFALKKTVYASSVRHSPIMSLRLKGTR